MSDVIQQRVLRAIASARRQGDTLLYHRGGAIALAVDDVERLLRDWERLRIELDGLRRSGVDESTPDELNHTKEETRVT